MWIEDFREREGLDLDEFTMRVNMRGKRHNPPLQGVVSDKLIHMLERAKKAVTHPRIANVIAEVCGATPEQRDMIVAPIHHGTWKPNMEPVVSRGEINTQPGGKPVVKINQNGDVLNWYSSVIDAARQNMHSEKFVRNYCRRNVEYEFTPYMPYTFRYASEWDAMSSQEKQVNIMAKRAGRNE